MSTKKLLIVGNEPEFIDEISSLIQTNFKNDLKIIGFANTVKEAIKIINKSIPDLLLMDLCLVDGSAFDILSVTNHNSNAILFLNEKDESIEKMLHYFSARYLLKPLDFEQFTGTIQEVINENKIDVPKIEKALIGNLSVPCLDKKLILKDNKSHRMIEIFTIVRFEVKDNYISIFLADGSNFKFVSTLKCIEKKLLKSDITFIRVHSNHLINMSQVKSYTQNNYNGKVEMIDGSSVSVSSRKKYLLLNFLKNQSNFIKSILVFIMSAYTPILVLLDEYL